MRIIVPPQFHDKNGVAVYMTKLTRELCQKRNELLVTKLDTDKRKQLEKEIKDLQNVIEEVAFLISEKLDEMKDVKEHLQKGRKIFQDDPKL